jgi:hypothetical protein
MVEDALHAVGQKVVFLGKKDPHLIPTGLPDLLFTRVLYHYKENNTPPWHIKPVPIQVNAATSICLLSITEASGLAIADMIILAFFFLL